MRGNQKGIGAVVIIIIVLVIVAVGGAGYFVMKRGGDALSNAASTVVTSAETQKALDDCKKEYNDSDLCKALSNFVGSKQYQTTFISTGSGSNMTYSMEIDGDKTYMKNTISGKSLETIRIGNITYTKDNTDGKWWKQVFESSAVTSSNDDYKFDTNLNNTTNKTTYTKLGQEACDKLTCIKYKISETNSKDVQYIWIDTKDHLMRKWSTESSDGSKMEAVYSYNKKSVDAPSSTKDASPTQNVIPADYTAAMMSSMGTNGSTTDNGSGSGFDDTTSSNPGSEEQSTDNGDDSGMEETEL